MSLGNEYTLVEKPAIDYFKFLGYSYINGKELTLESGERESFKEVILYNRMFTSLKKFNPEISEDNINNLLMSRYLGHISRKQNKHVKGPKKRNQKTSHYFLRELEKIFIEYKNGISQED